VACSSHAVRPEFPLDRDQRLAAWFGWSWKPRTRSRRLGGRREQVGTRGHPGLVFPLAGKPSAGSRRRPSESYFDSRDVMTLERMAMVANRAAAHVVAFMLTTSICDRRFPGMETSGSLR
jgi:hypothetical protein